MSDPDELRLALQKVARRIRANRADGDVADGQLSVLFLLDRQGDLSPTRIAEWEHVSAPSIHRTLGTLEEAGLVARRPDPDDARRVIVSISASGRALVGETRRRRSAWFEERLATLDTADRETLDAALPALRRLADS